MDDNDRKFSEAIARIDSVTSAMAAHSAAMQQEHEAACKRLAELQAAIEANAIAVNSLTKVVKPLRGS